MGTEFRHLAIQVTKTSRVTAGMMWPQLCFVALFVSLCNLKANAEFSSEDCSSLGFNKANLLCSSCDQLKDFGLESLQGHCRECCQKEESTDGEKFAKAVLEVCTCKFAAYPQIQAFIKSDRPAKFSNLQIRYGPGLDPAIKLQDKDGSIKQVVAIEKWNTDSIEEFLKTHLINDDEDDRDYLKTNRI